MKRAAVAWWAGAVIFAQSELPREVLDLAHIKTTMRENLERLPHYTCLETIERLHRQPGAAQFKLVDTLRIEVARIGREEFYSWPEARRFEGSVRQMVQAGTISTGEFSNNITSVFMNPAAQIRFAGRESWKGRAALKYDYQIAAFASGWTLTSLQTTASVGAVGSFWADADSLDLLELDSRAADIPAETPFLGAESRVAYSRAQIGDSSILLPQSAEVLLDLHTGTNRNAIEFSQCRPYTTQSAIHFDPELPAPAAAPAAVQERMLPANLLIGLRLAEAIDSRRAAEGDVLAARLGSDVKMKGQILAPKGATVRGRIRRFERYSDPDPHFIVGLEFVEIELGNQRWIFRGSLVQVDQIPGLSWALSTKRSELQRGGLLQPSIESRKGVTLSTSQIPGVGTFFVQGEKFQLPQGFNMVWRTVAGR